MTREIGYLTFSVDPTNGMGRMSRELLVRFVRRGIRARVLTYHRDQIDEELRAMPGLEIRPILPSHYDLGRLFTNLRWGRRVARELAGCELIHALFDYPHCELAARAARWLDLPYVASAIGTYSLAPLYAPRSAGRLAVAFLEAYRVIAISRYTLREIEKRVALANAVVVPLGVDAGALTRLARPESSAPADRFVVLGVGALKDRKGWDILIRALAEVRDLDPPVHVVVAGGLAIGDAATRYRELAVEVGVADRVTFTGLVSDAELARLYATSHIFVLPARSDHHKVEGFGLVYLEAGAFGLPQVGCLDTGAQDAIAEGASGLLVPQNDPKAVASAIRTLHTDVELRQRLGAGARARSAAMTWDATVEGILQHYPQGGERPRASATRRLITERIS